MKKKIFGLALVVALIAIMVSGTLAYFSDQDEVQNTFTIGSVKIEIFENSVATDDAVVEFKNQPLIPVVDMQNAANDPNYIPKVVEVKNTGANPAFIRTFIAVPTDLVGYLYLNLDETGWTRQADAQVTVDNVSYDVFTYDYDTAVNSGEFTGKLLLGAYLGSDVDLEEDANGNLLFVRKENGEIVHRSNVLAHTKDANGVYTSATVSILVASQAIQSQGFEGKTATEALNTGFAANPWASQNP